MNLARISELKNLISNLHSVLRRLNERKENLEREVANARTAPERIDDAVASAKIRVSELERFRFRPEFFEKILDPVITHPHGQGIDFTVLDEIAKITKEVLQTENKIYVFDQEQKQLEMEEP